MRKFAFAFSAVLWSAVVLAAGIFGGCGKTQTAAAPGQKKIILGMVGKNISNAVFQAADAGFRDAAKEMGPKYGVIVEVKILTPSHEDSATQSNAIDNLVRQGAAGIAVSCSDATTLTGAINRAADAGVPVVCFDSDAPNSKRFAFYGTDDIDCGKRVMQELAKAMGDKGTIAILAGNASAPNLQARVQGVLDELKLHPSMHELPNGVFYHPENPSDAAETVKMVQNANPSIQGWAFVGGWPLFAKNALNWAPGTIKVVSVDALPDELSYVKEGYVPVVLGQDCYGWGTQSVKLLLDKIVKHQNPPQVRNIAPLTPVTTENADEYAKRWSKWMAD